MQRTRSSEQTLQILNRYIPKSSITRIADLTFLDNTSSLRVFSAIRPSAKSISISMGKSLDVKLAQCGAIAESFETYLAEDVIPDLENISSSKLVKKIKILTSVNAIPNKCKFGIEYPLNWNIGYKIDSKDEVYIPTYLLSLNTNDLVNQLWGVNSDGIASGNTLEEALIVSLFERIERIAVAQNKRHILSFDKKILSKYNLSSEYHYIFFEYENIFKVPVVGVEIYHNNYYSNQCKFCGYGAAETYEFAIYRAFEEALQSKVGVISGARDDLKKEYYSLGNKVRPVSGVEESYGLYIDLNYTDLLELLSKIKALIMNTGHDIVVFEYFNDDISVVRTFLINRESNIL